MKQLCCTFDVHGYYQILSQEQEDITLQETVRRFEKAVRIHKYMKKIGPIASVVGTEVGIQIKFRSVL